MVEAVDIRDTQKLIEWLSGQPPSVTLHLAHRIGAKVLPFAEPDVWGYAESWGRLHERDRPRAALAAIRSNLLLQLLAYGTRPVPNERIIEFVDVAEREWISLDDIFDATISLGLSTPLYGLVGAVLAEKPDAHYTSDQSLSILRAETSAHAIAQARSQAVRVRNAKGESRSDWDAAAIAEALSDIEAAQSGAPRPLSLGADASGLWAKAREVWRGRGSSWDFWIRWYEDVLAGREPDWEVLREIALIPDDIWKQGAAAVAERIREIEKGNASAEGREPPSLNRVLELNRTAILLQLEALREFVSKEVDRLRGPNSLSRLEHEQRKKRIEKLNKIIEAVALMHEAMDAEPTGSTALTVIGKQLPAVIEAAEESIKLGGEPQVSEVIATMSITIKHLTDNGTPGNMATAVAFADLCWRKIKSWRAR